MHEILVPRVSTNDDACILREWMVDEAASVEPETLIAVIEDTKSAVDVMAGVKGFLKRLGEPGKEYRVGDVIAYVLPDEASARAFVPAKVHASPATGAMMLTKGARDLMAERGITEEEVKRLGKDVVRRSDIEGLRPGANEPSVSGVEMPKQQRTVARVVAESHQTIPKAFLLVKVSCEALLERIQGKPFGLTEIVVKIIGDLGARFPNVYARLERNRLVLPEGGINVGVTFDMGNGLFIPVVAGADAKTLGQVASDLAGFREKAMQGQFREADLVAGHIALSLNVGEGVIFSLPIILPGQTSMVSLGGVLEEVASGPSGGFVVRRCVNIGIAYDHRVINGSQAMEFMEGLKRKIEHPSSNRWIA